MVPIELDKKELSKIVGTFSYDEMGSIPIEYINVLHRLKRKYQLALVIDSWSQKSAWLRLFRETGIEKLFSALSFFSDHGMVKPSPEPFYLLMD